MTILLDEARWWWRGKKWCHLVSDTSYDELHDFADRTGIPRRGFQGDHYDIPEEYRAELIAAGAVQVDSRDLVRRLRAAGLRLSPADRRAQREQASEEPSESSMTESSVTESSVTESSVTEHRQG